MNTIDDDIEKPKNKRISSITPCYKMGAYLKTFLDELPKQTIPLDEMEIVLDHNEPSDMELQIVRNFQEKYPGVVRHICVNPVDPIGISMNRCIQEASADIVTIWNVDDLRTPTSLESQAKMFEEDPDVDVVHGNFVITNRFGAQEGKFIDHSQYVSGHPELTRGMVIGPFFAFRKELCNHCGFFDEQLKTGADYDLAVRLNMFAKKTVVVPGEILGYYLDEGKGASTRGDGRQPIERTAVEMRYKINDKVDAQYVPFVSRDGYDLDNVVQFGKKLSVDEIMKRIR